MTEDSMIEGLDSVSNAFIGLANLMGLVIDVRIEVRRQNGTRVVLIEGHGEHEVETDR